MAAAIGLLALSAPAPSFSASLEAVDVELVIATDVSPSIDQAEAHLQREGIVEAFLNPQVVQAIQAGSLGKIAVVYVDFSSREYNRIAVNWQVIKDKASAAAFAAKLRNAPPGFGRHTSISDAIELGEFLLEGNNLEGTKKVIDISGDGPNNWGRQINLVRDQAVARHITINGLPIVEEGGFGSYPDLDKYFSNCVIGGPAAFIVVAKGFQDFARAIRNKLILEIANDAPGNARANPLIMKIAAQPAAPRAQPLPRPQNTPTLNEKACGNAFGFGGFRGFDFPLSR